MEEEGKYKVMWKVGSEGLGSLRWPPRSYCCTFCSREFMSAQALGGHMNVHRRDKARLKQVNNWVRASSSGSGSQGEKVLKKQKLWEDLTVPEKEGDPNPLTSKYNLQNLVGVKEFGEATEDLDLELRL